MLTQFVFDSSRGVSSSKLFSMFRFPDSNTVHLQCDILLCPKDDCEEPLCVADPESETGRSLPVSSPGDDDDTRMMASTTVFVVEPGVTALGMSHLNFIFINIIALHCLVLFLLIGILLFLFSF